MLKLVFHVDPVAALLAELAEKGIDKRPAGDRTEYESRTPFEEFLAAHPELSDIDRSIVEPIYRVFKALGRQ